MIAGASAVSHSTQRLSLAVLLLFLFAFGHSIEVFAGEKVPPDGDLIDGAGTDPGDWLHVSQVYLKPEQAEHIFQWVHIQGHPSELQLSNPKRNVLRWERTVRLAPGLYHLTGEIRTEGLRPNLDLGNIGLELSRNMFGLSWLEQDQSSEWRKGELYFKVGDGDRDVDITCKLEGRGTVSCRRLILAKVATPVPNGINVIDLDKYPEEQHAQKPRPYDKPGGQIWTLFLTIVVLLAITVSGWIALGPRHE